MTITRVDIQGRQNTRDFVTEFMVQYSDDGNEWRMYMGPDGEDKVDMGGFKTAQFYLVSREGRD